MKVHQKHEGLNESKLYLIKDMHVKYELLDWLRHLSPLKSLYGNYSHLIEIIASSSKYSQSSIEYSDLEKYFKPAIMIYALDRSIRQNAEQGLFKEHKMDFSSFTTLIRYTESFNQGYVTLLDFDMTLDKKNSSTIKFSDAKEVMISLLNVGLNLGILNE